MVDLSGIEEHGERHDGVERVLRRLTEQVAQLSIALSVPRVGLRKVTLEVAGKVTDGEFDPSTLELNEGIKEARVKLAAAQEAADEQWLEFNDELEGGLDELRDEQADE